MLVAYQLSKPSAKDNEAILRYTLENWGILQFERYHNMIQEAMNEIDKNPNCRACRSRDELFVGCHSRAFGKHVIFYRIQSGEVEVVRVLHQKMDYRRHLQL